MEAMTLYELNNQIKGILQYNMDSSYWVQAEISSMSVAYNGHCYLELVQKGEGGTAFLAKAKANIWKSTFLTLRPFFEKETGMSLAVGLSVLLKVSVTFHEVFGYSLNVTDIDPKYTMGDMARRRKEILEQLKKDGILELNKELSMPMLPQRVAIVSSATAAGYGDFCNQLDNNVYGFAFYHKLFPAVMQGDNVEQSVIDALNKIAFYYELFDVVVIIRGGGAVSELCSFDSYNLAVNVANFPLPVITGIGHDRDDTVIDVVSHTKVKTPTAAAEYLVNRVAESAALFDELKGRLADVVISRMESEKHSIALLSQKIPSLFSVLKAGQERVLGLLAERASGSARRYIVEQTFKGHTIQIRLQTGLKDVVRGLLHKLDLMEKTLQAAEPEQILRRGYSMTMHDGKLVTDVSVLHEGDILETRFANGIVQSDVRNIKNKRYGTDRDEVRGGNETA